MNRTVDVFIDIELGFAQPVPYDGMIVSLIITLTCNIAQDCHYLFYSRAK